METPGVDPEVTEPPAEASATVDVITRSGLGLARSATRDAESPSSQQTSAGGASPRAEALVPSGGRAGGAMQPGGDSLYEPSWPPRGGARRPPGNKEAAGDASRAQSPPGDEPADEATLRGPSVKRLSGENMELCDLPVPLARALARAEASLEGADAPPSPRGAAGASPSSARVLFPGGEIISVHQEDDPGAWSPRKVNRGTGSCWSCGSKPPPPRFA